MSGLTTDPAARRGAVALAGIGDPTASAVIDGRAVVGAAAVLLGMVTWLFWDFLSGQVRWAITAQADWGHTLVIPFIAGYFVYLKREQLLAEPFRTAWIGLVPILLGTAWYMICALGPATLRHHNLLGAGVAATLFGLVLLLFGFRAMRWLWFPLAYLAVFGQTISDRLMNIVTFEMQDITARGSHLLLIVLGLDVDRLGNTLYLFDEGAGPPRALNIAEACSGMRMLMAFLALGVAMAYTGLKRVWQRVALVVLAVPTAIFVNVLRVVTLALLSLLDTDFAAGDFHTFVGLVWLIPAFLIFLGFLWIIRRTVVEEQAPAAATRAPGPPGA